MVLAQVIGRVRKRNAVKSIVFPGFPNAWICLAALTLLVRGAVVVAGWEDLRQDPDAYQRLAVNLALHGTYGFENPETGQIRPTAYRPPLYPWLLSFLVDRHTATIPPVRTAVLHVLLGVATVVCVHAIGERLRPGIGWLGGLAVAIDPLLLRSSQLVMTETLATCLAALAWWCWLAWLLPRWEAVATAGSTASGNWMAGAGTGAVFGLSILARPTSAVWSALCAAALVVAAWRSFRTTRLQWIASFLGGIALCVLPWMGRNAWMLGRPVWATTHGGYTLLLANNPSLYDHFRRHGPSRNWDAESFHRLWAARFTSRSSPTRPEYWLPARQSPQPPTDSPPPAPDGLGYTPPADELADDRLAYAAALATIGRDPEMFALSCIYRLGWLWAPWPHAAAGPSRWAIGVWYAIWSLLALIAFLGGRWARRPLPWAPGLLLVLALSAVHAVYWSNMRMRAPAMAAVYLLAASGIADSVLGASTAMRRSRGPSRSA